MMPSESTTIRKAGSLSFPARKGWGKTKTRQCFKRCGCNRVRNTRFENNQLKIDDQRGFTLPEVIVTLIAIGILAVFYIHYMGTAMDFSWKSVELVEGEARAEGLMERIIAEYVEQINSDPDNALATIKGLEVTYETDPNYGSPVTMAYITYDSAGNEGEVSPPATSNNLKVTVEAPGNNFTTVLTKSRTDADNPIVYY